MVIEAFRGVGKSWITAAYVLWVLWRDPQANIMVVSASKTRADNFSTFCQMLIKRMPLLAHLKPKPDQRDSKIAFDVGPAEPDQAPSVMSVGVGGQMTGSRADLIVADDVEVLNNSMTQTQREKIANTVREFDAILKPGGRIVFLGTPQTQESLYNILVDERQFSVRIWPARFPSEKLRTQYGDRLAPIIAEAIDADRSLVDKPTDPDRFSDEDLMRREASYGRSGFALQFMLDTSLSDSGRYPLKLRDLVVMDLPGMNRDGIYQAPQKVTWMPSKDTEWSELPAPAFSGDKFHRPHWVSEELAPYSGSILAIDPSGRGTDETAYCVVKMLHGYLFLVDAGGLRDGYTSENLKFLASVAKVHKVNKIVIEGNFGDGMFEQLFKPVLTKIYPCATEEVKHHVQKERRIIDTLEPVMNQHRLVVDRRVVEKDWEDPLQYRTEDAGRYRMFYQMTHITHERGCLAHDDRLDCLAIAVNYWTERMGTDEDMQMEQRREELREEELRRFKENAMSLTGRPYKGRGYKYA